MNVGQTARSELHSSIVPKHCADLSAGARDLLIAPEQLDVARPCEARIVLTAEASDKAGAKSLLVNDAQPGANP